MRRQVLKVGEKRREQLSYSRTVVTFIPQPISTITTLKSVVFCANTIISCFEGTSSKPKKKEACSLWWRAAPIAPIFHTYHVTTATTKKESCQHTFMLTKPKGEANQQPSIDFTHRLIFHPIGIIKHENGRSRRATARPTNRSIRPKRLMLLRVLSGHSTAATAAGSGSSRCRGCA
jgi:hypothetical protein